MKLYLVFAVLMVSVVTVRAGQYDGVIDLRDRLCALDPEHPRGYFELGEEVAYEMGSAEGRALAERLFVLSLERDLRDGGRHGLAASACLALADLTPRKSEREWLLALAQTFRAEGEGVFADVGSEGGVGELRVGEAISLFRGQANRAARERLRREDGAVVFEEFREDLDSFGMSTESLDRAPSCPECRNRRVVRPSGSRSADGQWVPCGTCGGNPGARLDEHEFVGLLVIEGGLLGVQSESWSAQYMVDGGEPVRDVDPSELALWYGVDPGADIYQCPEGDDWRDGVWVSVTP